MKTVKLMQEQYLAPECQVSDILLGSLLCASGNGTIDDLTVEPFDWENNL